MTPTAAAVALLAGFAVTVDRWARRAVSGALASLRADLDNRGGGPLLDRALDDAPRPLRHP